MNPVSLNKSTMLAPVEQSNSSALENKTDSVIRSTGIFKRLAAIIDVEIVKVPKREDPGIALSDEVKKLSKEEKFAQALTIAMKITTPLFRKEAMESIASHIAFHDDLEKVLDEIKTSEDRRNFISAVANRIISHNWPSLNSLKLNLKQLLDFANKLSEEEHDIALSSAASNYGSYYGSKVPLQIIEVLTGSPERYTRALKEIIFNAAYVSGIPCDLTELGEYIGKISPIEERDSVLKDLVGRMARIPIWKTGSLSLIRLLRVLNQIKDESIRNSAMEDIQTTPLCEGYSSEDLAKKLKEVQELPSDLALSSNNCGEYC